MDCENHNLNLLVDLHKNLVYNARKYVYTRTLSLNRMTKSTKSTDLNLNLDHAIITSFDWQHKHALVSSGRTDANEEMSRGLVAKEICSLGFVHVTCEPTGNEIKKCYTCKEGPREWLRKKRTLAQIEGLSPSLWKFYYLSLAPSRTEIDFFIKLYI